jgi:hypothetical protein
MNCAQSVSEPVSDFGNPRQSGNVFQLQRKHRFRAKTAAVRIVAVGPYSAMSFRTHFLRIVLTGTLLALLAWVLAAESKQFTDGEALMKASLEASESNWDLAKDYTWQVTETERRHNKDGSVKSTKSETFDVTLIDGTPYRRLIAKDGEPLSEKEAARQQKKLDKEIDKRLNENNRQRNKRIREEREEKERREAMMRAIPEAFHFEIVGEEAVRGRPAYVLTATPNPEFEPFNRETKWLPKFKGRLYIDRESLLWLKADVETVETISFGWIIARVGKGAHMTFEQQLINNEVMLPSRMLMEFDARVALLKKLTGEFESTYANYRKFSTDSQIVNTELAESRPAAEPVAEPAPEQ